MWRKLKKTPFEVVSVGRFEYSPPSFGDTQPSLKLIKGECACTEQNERACTEQSEAERLEPSPPAGTATK